MNWEGKPRMIRLDDVAVLFAFGVIKIKELELVLPGHSGPF